MTNYRAYVATGANGTADTWSPLVPGAADIPFVNPPVTPPGGGGGPPPPPPPTDPAVLPYWGAPTWREEFDAFDSRHPSGVNVDRWRVRDGETLSYDQAYYIGKAQNVLVRPDISCVQIVAVRESGQTQLGGVYKTGSTNPQPAAKTWTSGYIDTIGKSSFKYGRWECRAKLNTHATGTRGVWPAIWTRPDGGGDGEFDLMEAYGGPWAISGYRLGSAQATLWQSYASNNHPNAWLTPGDNNPDLSADFHLYAVEWTPSYIAFFRDDVQYKKWTPADTPWFTTSFFDKFHFRLQLQMGNSYWGMTDPAHPEWTNSPTEPFLVDYVRYWAYPG